MNTQDKIIPFDQLFKFRNMNFNPDKKWVVTNGCFDILHVGHVKYLEAARNLGDTLIVGLNSDRAVRLLKGEGRPLNSEMDRATVLAALECVSYVCIFDSNLATEFLRAAHPDVYVKGGDYTIETLNAEERAVVLAAKAEIVIIPSVPGKSTTATLKKIGHI